MKTMRVLGMAMLVAQMLACSQSAPAPATPAPDREAEVAEMLSRATAISNAAKSLLRNSRLDDATLTHARAAYDSAKNVISFIRTRQPNWLFFSRPALANGEKELRAALGGRLTPDQCDADVRIVFSEGCAKVLADAESAADTTKRADDMLPRADAVFAIAAKALQLDGSRTAAKVANEIADCSGEPKACVDMAVAANDASRVGSLAGLAAYLAKRAKNPTSYPSLDRRETALAQAEAAAKKAMEEAEGQEQKEHTEEPTIAAARNTCIPSDVNCKARCEKGDMAFCVAWAVRLRDAKPPRLGEAKAVLTKACAGGLQSACSATSDVDKELEAFAAESDNLWRDVERVGDDLARKKFQDAFVREHANTARNQIALGRMATHVAILMKDSYCPAKKAFVAHAGAGEFTKRAAAHCKDSPPTGSGLAGAEVTLTSQCQGSFAAGCP